MKLGGYGIDAWIFLAFIVFVAVYPAYAVVRSIANSRRGRVSTTKPSNAPQSDTRSSRPPTRGGTSGTSSVAGSAPPEHREVRDLVFRREMKPNGTGVFTLGYPSPHDRQGREWIAGMHHWFGDRVAPGVSLPEDELNRSAITFIRRYYPSAEWIGRPENHLENDPKWPLVTTGHVRVLTTDHVNR